ncbi:MAG TPA: YhjD/YihY/BrkB family envelope integrity protein [Candidatus Acidoferrales bacterium]|jgi:membrane protein|nr:YhjD/YihY/BrkB family envelope integrity protein [Candidatus Acidoferrales bacterium]
MASNRFSRLLKIWTGTSSGEDEELIQLEGRLERTVHFWTLVARHFVRNRCLIRASALAYTSLLALIPLLVVIISISTLILKNVDADKFYQTIASIAPPATITTTENTNPVVTLTTNMVVSEDALNGGWQTNQTVITNSAASVEMRVSLQGQIAQSLKEFVAQTGTSFGVTGMLAFVFIAIMMLSRVEETFNDIWGVARGRGWLTRVFLYWGAITLGPALLFGAAGLAGSGQLQTVRDYFHAMPLFGNFIFKLLPLIVLWITFTLIYQIVPNTRVRFSAALTGGVVAGTLWHLNSIFAFFYVSGAVMNSHMYGKVGLVLVFMLGLYFSWAILLFGAQVAYAFQNRAAYLQDKLADNVNQRGREFVALRLMTLIGQRFQSGQKPASVIQLATDLGVPSRLTQQVLRTLTAAHLVTEVGGVETAYAPARPLDTINAHHILLALRSGSGRELPVTEQPALAEIYGEFARIEDAERTAAEKISLLALATRMPAQPAIEAPKPSHITQITDALVVEEISKTEPPEPVPAKNLAEEAPAPVPDIAPPPAETAPEVAPEKSKTTTARRETVKPKEHDFPL